MLHPGTLEPSLGASYHPQLPTWVPLYPLLERWLVGVGYDKQILDLPLSVALSVHAWNINNNYTGNHLLVHEAVFSQTKSFYLDKFILASIRRFAEIGLLEGFLPVGYGTDQLSKQPLSIVDGWLVGVDYGQHRLIFPPSAAIQYIIDTGKENNVNLKRSAPIDIAYDPRLLALITALDCRSLEAVKLLTSKLRKAAADSFFTMGEQCTADEDDMDSNNILFHLVDNMTRDKEGHHRPYDWAILEYLLLNNKVTPTSQDPFSKDNILHKLVYNNDEDAVYKLLYFYEELVSKQKPCQRESKLFYLKLFYTLLYSTNKDGNTSLDFAKREKNEMYTKSKAGRIPLDPVASEKNSNIISLLEDAHTFVGSFQKIV